MVHFSQDLLQLQSFRVGLRRVQAQLVGARFSCSSTERNILVYPMVCIFLLKPDFNCMLVIVRTQIKCGSEHVLLHLILRAHPSDSPSLTIYLGPSLLLLFSCSLHEQKLTTGHSTQPTSGKGLAVVSGLLPPKTLRLQSTLRLYVL